MNRLLQSQIFDGKGLVANRTCDGMSIGTREIRAHVGGECVVDTFVKDFRLLNLFVSHRPILT
jgi:hypothetical protein